MGITQSTPLINGIKAALDHDSELYAFPGRPFYQLKHVRPYNLDRPVTPAAITYPKSKEQIAAIVKVAVEFGVKVQARSGGHSYANYCKSSIPPLGDGDGILVRCFFGSRLGFKTVIHMKLFRLTYNYRSWRSQWLYSHRHEAFSTVQHG